MSHRNITKAGPRDERAHPVVTHAIDNGYVITGAPYPIDGFATHDAANAGRRSIRLAGQHLGVSVAAWVTDADGERCYKSCADPNAPHGVRFRLFTKESGRQKVVTDSGGDPANLKYNPFRGAAPRLLDDQGKRIG